MHRDLSQYFKFQTEVMQSPTEIYGDNSACIQITSGSDTKHARTKHWSMNWHWLHEQRTALKTFVPKWISGKVNYADLLTKPLPLDTHTRYVSELGLPPLGQSNYSNDGNIFNFVQKRSLEASYDTQDARSIIKKARNS